MAVDSNAPAVTLGFGTLAVPSKPLLWAVHAGLTAVPEKAVAQCEWCWGGGTHGTLPHSMALGGQKLLKPRLALVLPQASSGGSRSQREGLPVGEVTHHKSCPPAWKLHPFKFMWNLLQGGTSIKKSELLTLTFSHRKTDLGR